MKKIKFTVLKHLKIWSLIILAVFSNIDCISQLKGFSTSSSSNCCGFQSTVAQGDIISPQTYTPITPVSLACGTASSFLSFQKNSTPIIFSRSGTISGGGSIFQCTASTSTQLFHNNWELNPPCNGTISGINPLTGSSISVTFNNGDIIRPNNYNITSGINCVGFTLNGIVVPSFNVNQNTYTITFNSSGCTPPPLPGGSSMVNWACINGNPATIPGTATGQNYLGTPDAKRLVIATGNGAATSAAVERMTVLSGPGVSEENVGINTTSPTKKLHVEGDARITNTPTLGLTPSDKLLFVNSSGDIKSIASPTNSTNFLRSDGTWASVGATGGSNWNIVGNNSLIDKTTAIITPITNENFLGTTDNKRIIFGTGDNTGSIFERMTVMNQSGNVGINEMNPARKLHIEGDARITNMISSGLGIGDKLMFKASNGDLKTISSPLSGTSGFLFSNGDWIDLPRGAENGLRWNSTSKKIELGDVAGGGIRDADLLNSRELNLKNFKFNWNDGGGDEPNGKITIGYVTSASADADNSGRLSVNVYNVKTDKNSLLPSSNLAAPNTLHNTIGIFVRSKLDAISVPNGSSYGIYSIGEGVSNAVCQGGTEACGVHGVGKNGYFSLGVSGEARNTGCGGGFFGTIYPNFTGVFGKSVDPTIWGANMGIRGYSDNGHVSYGVVGDGGLNDIIPPGSGTSGPNYAGYFKGDILTEGDYYQLSDLNYKENITNIDITDLDCFHLEAKKFYFKQDKNLSLPGAERFGFIAQEVEQIYPNLVRNARLVKEDNTFEDAKVVNYTGFIPLLWKGFCDLSQSVNTVEESSRELSQLKNQISTLENKVSMLESFIYDLMDKKTNLAVNKIQTKLNNAIPNPSSEKTNISYFLNQKFKTTELLIINTEGGIIERIKLENKLGEGEIDLSLKNYKDGIYIYSLILDGKNFDSKRLEVTRLK